MLTCLLILSFRERLRSILENIKNSTKTVLTEMQVYLEEMENVEKTYIRCRAKAQKESRRLEQVEPDVAGATQRYLTQASALLGNGAAGGFDMAAMMGGMHGASAGTDWFIILVWYLEEGIVRLCSTVNCVLPKKCFR